MISMVSIVGSFFRGITNSARDHLFAEKLQQMHPRNAAFARAAIGRTTFRIFARCDGFAKLFRREGAGGQLGALVCGVKTEVGPSNGV